MIQKNIEGRKEQYYKVSCPVILLFCYICMARLFFSC